MHQILVLGGYGNFGAIISRALSLDTAIRLWIGGRDLRRAQAFTALLDTPSSTAVAIDAHAADLADQLRSLGIQTVIHAAGPFQGQDYSVAEACIASRCNYIDLADGRRFVAGIGTLHERAAQAGVLVTSGASTVPALTSAVVDHLLPEFASLRVIRHGISAGGHTPGPATMRGVLGYCGKPFTWLCNGEWVTGHGWLGLQRRLYAAPVSGRWLGSCDVPDLELFPARYVGVQTVQFQAGVGNPLSHLSLWGLSGLVRMGLIPSLVPLASMLAQINEWLVPLSPVVSALHVELRGTDHAGRELVRRWQLIAYDNHGPQIPTGAAIALTRKLAAGELTTAGAMPCMGLLSLEEYLGAISHLRLRQISL